MIVGQGHIAERGHLGKFNQEVGLPIKEDIIGDHTIDQEVGQGHGKGHGHEVGQGHMIR